MSETPRVDQWLAGPFAYVAPVAVVPTAPEPVASTEGSEAPASAPAPAHPAVIEQNVVNVFTSQVVAPERTPRTEAARPMELLESNANPPMVGDLPAPDEPEAPAWMPAPPQPVRGLQPGAEMSSPPAPEISEAAPPQTEPRGSSPSREIRIEEHHKEIRTVETHVAERQAFTPPLVASEPRTHAGKLVESQTEQAALEPMKEDKPQQPEPTAKPTPVLEPQRNASIARAPLPVASLQPTQPSSAAPEPERATEPATPSVSIRIGRIDILSRARPHAARPVARRSARTHQVDPRIPR